MNANNHWDKKEQDNILYLSCSLPTGILSRDTTQRNGKNSRNDMPRNSKPNNTYLIQEIMQTEKKGAVTLLYSAKDTAHNNAVALKAIMERG